MADRSRDMLCRASELAEKSLDFFDGNIDACPEGVGREVFEYLRDAERQHMDKIKEIADSMAGGEDWAGACSLGDEEETELEAFFQSMVGKYPEAEAYATEVGALNMALDLVMALVTFYEEWLDEAEDDTEREFLERMVQMQRGHYELLTDLQYYYEDPEGWAMEQDGSSLDGA